MKMRALKAQPFGGKRYNVGDEFEVRRSREAKSLKALKLAEDVVEVPKVLETPAPVVEERVKRTYRRRDMTAEGTASAMSSTDLKPE